MRSVILEGDWVVVELMGKAAAEGWYVESFILLTAFDLSRSIRGPNAGKFMAHKPRPGSRISAMHGIMLDTSLDLATVPPYQRP